MNRYHPVSACVQWPGEGRRGIPWAGRKVVRFFHGVVCHGSCGRGRASEAGCFLEGCGGTAKLDEQRSGVRVARYRERLVKSETAVDLHVASI